MIARCYNSNDRKYKDYGGRGIIVCDRWLEKFKNFLEDMKIPPSEQHSLDRIDVNGNYEPNNCKWSTQKEQQNNRRDTYKILHNNELVTITYLVEKFNIKRATLKFRLNNGWTIEEALNIPVGERILSNHGKQLKINKSKIWVEYKGQKRRIIDLAKEYNIKYPTLRLRIISGMTIENAINHKTRTHYK